MVLSQKRSDLMNKDQKKKVLIAGGAVAVVGAYALSQRGKESPAGTLGNIIGAPMDAMTGAVDTGVGAETPAGQTIADILGSLPELPNTGGDSFGMPPGFSDLPPDVGGMTAVPKKAKIGFPSLPGFQKGLISGTAKVGGAIITSPAAGMQVLGGTSARVADTVLMGIVSPSTKKQIRKAQAKRVTKYPRASHAVAMVTGGATAKAPVTKKQVAARKKYPTVYKVWKGAFGWLGA